MHYRPNYPPNRQSPGENDKQRAQRIRGETGGQQPHHSETWKHVDRNFSRKRATVWATQLRVATLNIFHYSRIAMTNGMWWELNDEMQHLLHGHAIDILCLQDTKIPADRAPQIAEAFSRQGFQFYSTGATSPFGCATAARQQRIQCTYHPPCIRLKAHLPKSSYGVLYEYFSVSLISTFFRI